MLIPGSRSGAALGLGEPQTEAGGEKQKPSPVHPSVGGGSRGAGPPPTPPPAQVEPGAAAPAVPAPAAAGPPPPSAGKCTFFPQRSGESEPAELPAC